MKNTAVRWLFSTRLLAWFEILISKLLRKMNLIVLSYNDPERSEVLKMINEVKRERHMLLDRIEGYQLFMAVKKTEKVKGDIVEVGVYTGGSARIICEAMGNRVLHLFDTFEGIPQVQEIDSKKFAIGMFSASIESVKDYLKKYRNVHFYRGLFPDTAEPIKDKKFSLVNLDVDTYESTLNCLKFFYPRMSLGGVLVSHDYNSAKGVRKAFDEFFSDKPEPVIELCGSQCLFVKI